MLKWRWLTVTGLAMALFGLTSPGQSQRPNRPKGGEPPVGEVSSPALPRAFRPKAYALLNAKVIVAPGEVVDKTNLIIRDGVIAAIGPDESAPPDAIRIDLAGKTVCAGFIDAASSWGFDTSLRRS